MALELNLREIQKYDRIPGKPNMVRLSKISPAMRLGTEDGAYFIQHGKVFDAGGGLIAEKDLPGWFKDLVAKANPAALAECGYKLPEPKKG